MAVLTSAGSVLALLDEPQPELKTYALQKLDDIVDVFWAEISDSISKIESLYEDDKFAFRNLAALVASKVFYHLGEFNDALQYALGAGPLFDVTVKNEYVDTLVAKCIDEYISLKVKQSESPVEPVVIDPRLEAIVERMFDRCFKDGEFKQAIGISLESRRLDKVEQAIMASKNVPGLLEYCFDLALSQVQSRSFRHQVLNLLVKLHKLQSPPDYVAICQAFMFLDDAPAVANVLDTLIKQDEDHTLLAYQVAFDLCDSELQQFLINVRALLPAPVIPSTPAPAAPAPETPAPAPAPPADSASSADDAMETDEKTPLLQRDTPAPSPPPAPAPAPAEPPAPELPKMSDEELEQLKKYVEKLDQLRNILSGEVSVALYMEFLYRNNHADLLILKNIKTAVETRNSVCHSSTIFANALMHAGTTVDIFLRENLEWLARATNWAKFSATAGLGVIHKGHMKESLALLGPYLPSAGQSSSPFSEGGALYALGLIHANHGADIVKYLSTSLRNAGTNEVVQHGACLGLGLAGMTTSSEEMYDELKNVLFSDSAVAGEAAAIGMGLVMVGSASDKALDEMLTYAHETQHEKIIRGLAMGIALVMYGREEEADTLIEQLTRDKDPILRYGGMYAIGLAYSGTANNSAIRRLLHVAVSDVSDDVRRAAVTSLGFVLFRVPQQCPRIVQLLAESYNPHVRYGATLAVGISCAGTGLREAVELLEPLTTDAVDFVRQGALIALAMVLIQQTAASQPKVTAVRKLFEKVINDKHEEVMTKFGAIVASGILDAGGRNVTISLSSRAGHRRLSAIVGMAIFTQFWYWYPLMHFVSLSFTPTALIALNKNLKMPKFEFQSNVKPSMFAYPPPATPPSAAAPTKAPTAVLSVTARARARARQAAASTMTTSDIINAARAQTKTTEPMDVTPTASATAPASPASPAPTTAIPAAASSPVPAPLAAGEKPVEEKKKDEEPAKKKEVEAAFEVLNNPARVTVQQERYITFYPDKRYVPIQKGRAIGIIILKDNTPNEPEDLITLTAPTAGAAPPEEDEPTPPEPFNYP